MAALQSLVAKMLLPYDFQYFSMEFPQDVAVISVSETKSILPVTLTVPLAAGVSSTVASQHTTEVMTECFRVYLAILRDLDVSIGNEQAEVAEKHYVECRREQQDVSVRGDAVFE